MQIKLVFNDWRDKKGLSIYGTYLSDGQFHAGTTFNGAIYLDDEDAAELTQAIKDGNMPVFDMVLP